MSCKKCTNPRPKRQVLEHHFFCAHAWMSIPLLWVHIIEHAATRLPPAHHVTSASCRWIHRLMDLFCPLIKLKARKASPSDSLHWRNPLWLIRFFSVSVSSMKIYDFGERGKRVFFVTHSWQGQSADRQAVMSLMLSEIFSGWMKVKCINMFKGDSVHTH